MRTKGWWNTYTYHIFKNPWKENDAKTCAGGDGEEDDCSKGNLEQVETHGEQEEEGEEERRRTDEGCQAAMSITTTEEQTQREEEQEDDGVENGSEALEQIQSNDQNCLQQPCL